LLTVLEENDGIKAKDAAAATTEKLGLGSDVISLMELRPNGSRMNLL
jgi:hypothetical protein